MGMHPRRSAVPTLATLALCGSAAFAVDPTRIYLHNESDAFDFMSKAYIAQQLGIIDANGTIGSLEANGDVKIGGQVVGKQIKVGGRLVGFSNAAGTVEMYNIGGLNFDNLAFRRLANNGTLDLFAHGLVRVKEENGMRRELKGGAFKFGQEFRKGFRDVNNANGGTGVNDVPFAYSLTPVANRTVTLNLNNCYSSRDPDGAGPERSLVASATDIAGINPVNGFANEVNAGPTFTIVGGTNQEQFRLFQKVKVVNRTFGQFYTAAQAQADGLGDLDDDGREWVAFSKYWYRQDLAMHAEIQNFVKSGDALLRATYSTGAVAPRGVPDPYSFQMPLVYTPRVIVDPLTSDSYTLSYWQSERGAAEITLGPGDLLQPVEIHIRQRMERYALAPAPGSQPYLASGVFDFRSTDDGPDIFLAGEAQYELELDPEAGLDATVYFLSPGGWEPVPTFISNGRLFARDARIGVYAAFSSIPAPGTALVLAMSAAVASRRRRRD